MLNDTAQQRRGEQPLPSTTTDLDTETPFQRDIERWAQASVSVLQEVASTYGDYITYSDLASRVFEATGTSTRMLVQNLTSRLLNRVIHICLEENLPALSSLVVSATDGTVGRGFDAVLRAAGKDIPQSELERERAAAVERLECYKQCGADVPTNAEPQLTLKYEARVNPPKKQSAEPKPVCPDHGIQLPATGICDYCA